MIAIRKKSKNLQTAQIYSVLVLAAVLVAMCLWAAHNQKVKENKRSESVSVLAPASEGSEFQNKKVGEDKTKQNPDGSVTLELNLNDVSFSGMNIK